MLPDNWRTQGECRPRSFLPAVPARLPMKLLLVQLMRCGYSFEHCCLREFRPQESTFGKCSAIAWAGFTWAFVLSFIFYHLRCPHGGRPDIPCPTHVPSQTNPSLQKDSPRGCGSRRWTLYVDLGRVALHLSRLQVLQTFVVDARKLCLSAWNAIHFIAFQCLLLAVVFKICPARS